MSGSGDEVASVRPRRRPRVVAGTGEFTAQVFVDIPAEHEIDLWSASLRTPDDVANSTRGADAVVVDYETLSAAHIEAMATSVKIIGYSGTGLDVVDLEAARARGIAVVYLPGFATDEVADHTLALMLAGLRRLRRADQVARSNWREWRSIGPLRSMSEVTVGLVGLGRIGRAVLTRVQAFGSRTVIFDPALREPPEAASLAKSLDDLLSAVDVLSLQIPLTPATKGLLSTREFRMMKSNALVVNASRGGVIDESALVEALRVGEIGGACLDVVETEPLSASAGISSAPNTVLTPHVAWHSVSAENRSRDQTLWAVAAFVRGESIPCGVLA